MKDNFTHVCFIIDESGSMYSSVSDVKGGFKKIIEEQKANTVGTCAVSMYTFANNTKKHFVFKDIKEVESELNYSPCGGTALNDAVGQAIDEIGEILAGMPEAERPSSNLIVIMTDGEENSSVKYSLSQVKEKIKHQTDKYSWAFMYLGADITDSSVADSLDLKYRVYSTKGDLSNTYDMLNSVLNTSRSCSAKYASQALDASILTLAEEVNADYASKTGIKLSSLAQ